MRLLILLSLAAIIGLKGKELIASQDSNPHKVKNISTGTSHKQEKRPPTRIQAQTATEASSHVHPKFAIAYTLTGFGGNHEKKMREALARLAWVVKSEAFKLKVLNHTYKGKRTFYQNAGMTNEQIYQSILKAAETLNPVEDGRMELKLTLYHSPTNTVGYTYPNTNEIWVNRKYFERYSLAEVANNAMHEWLHKIGFEHSYYNNPDRPYTVPYAIGEIVEEVIKDLDPKMRS